MAELLRRPKSDFAQNKPWYLKLTRSVPFCSKSRRNFVLRMFVLEEESVTLLVEGPGVERSSYTEVLKAPLYYVDLQESACVRNLPSDWNFNIVAYVMHYMKDTGDKTFYICTPLVFVHRRVLSFLHLNVVRFPRIVITLRPLETIA
jgi:hypothetical protein